MADELTELQNKLDELQSFIKMQELEMEWRIEEQVDSKLQIEFNRGVSVGKEQERSLHNSNVSRHTDQIKRAIQHELPKWINEVIPEDVKSVMNQLLSPTIDVSAYVPMDAEPASSKVTIHFPPKTLQFIVSPVIRL